MVAIALAGAFGMAPAHSAPAAEQVLNIYSARHYPTDEALYADFSKATGIQIKRVDSDDAGIRTAVACRSGWFVFTHQVQ